MRRLDHELSRLAERGDPLGADLLIDRLEHRLAGDPDPIVVARRRSGIMQTSTERAIQEPGPKTRRTGLAVALASFIAVLVAGSGILLWAAFDGDRGSETAAPATTQAPPVTTVEAVGTFTFDGTTFDYDGPSTIGAGPVTFSLVNTSSETVSVISYFELTPAELDAALAAAPVGTDVDAFTVPPPEGDFMDLVKAGPGESTSWVATLPAGSHLVEGVTFTSEGQAGHIWRLAVIDVTDPTASEVHGRFTFDGTEWSFDLPPALEAGAATFSLVNTSTERVSVISYFELTPAELEAALGAAPIGIDFAADDVPPPDGDFMDLIRSAAPGETTTWKATLPPGTHMVEGVTIRPEGHAEHVWRLAILGVIPPATGDVVGTFTFDGTTFGYDGPSTIEAGPATFTLVNASAETVSVISYFQMTRAQIDAELALAPIGTDFAAGTPEPPDSDFMDLVKAGPGESTSWVATLPAGSHLVEGVTFTTEGQAEHIWRVGLITVVEP